VLHPGAQRTFAPSYTVTAASGAEVVAAPQTDLEEALTVHDETTAQDAATTTLDWRHFEPMRLPPILRHAMEAFAEHGYHGTSVRDIARRVGQTVPAIYYHYENKQALLFTLVTDSLEDAQARCRAAEAEADDDPVDRFRMLITSIVLYIANRRELSFLEGEIRSLEPDKRDACVAMRDEIEGMVVAAIEDGVSQGRFTTEYPADAARAVLAMCLGVATWYRPDGRLTPEQLAERYVDFALGAVGGA
jgi:TetR/AcrR family transcriptional regulator, cholesterol catabolism regulator